MSKREVWEKLCEAFREWLVLDGENHGETGLTYERNRALCWLQLEAPAVLERLESTQPAERDGEWVSCEERVPQDDRIVLVWNDDWGPNSYAATGRHVDDGSEHGSWHMEDDDEDPEQITHWMPLPAPPQPKGTK